MRRLLALAALLLTLAGTTALTTASPAFAQETEQAPKTSLYEIERQVMCVTCRTSLSVAGGPQADRQRDLIKSLIAEGKDSEQIKDALVLEYGQAVLALPEDDGFNIAVYLVPVLVVLAALVLAALFLPRWRRHARAVAGAQQGPLEPELNAADARRLDDDLKRYD
ncbi:cytochrome c-type biogenesis protein CcmH [Conexibacter stalactiti]|uniref:Cytochrome c-type biogenesis protein n=1 Tax=Conexibacter stalactiti TaxID=1940611 RepID=A0ABU4HK99_9ACTN|nr:cytochrome c-type biogenesis protein CcmH [Conexibacter stalactiti]MDW5593122.1 cytochrome c-type biogenesis protein CcmH [Conexibacter stalactiti]MEC5033763.1 cytochrome c-type biogenesis protein CcmH [Conexibacter stalactiti]